MEYWDFLPKKLTIPEFPQKEAIRRLNKARVALKHHGILPSKTDIEAYRASSKLFFEEATVLVFGLEFYSISLIEYVSPEESRNHLKNAQKLCSTANYEDAASEVALAFEKMISNYESNKSEWRFDSPFFFGKDMTSFSSSRMGIDRNEFRRVAEFVDKVKDSIEAIQQAIKILALGLDYRKYSKFKLSLPHIDKAYSGDYIVDKRSLGRRPSPDNEYIEFCISFVVECAIKLNEFNYEIRKS